MRPTRWTDRLLALTVLVTIWVLLWGVLSWLTVIGGLLAAVVILVVFPLPPVSFGGRLRPFGILRFGGRLAVDLLVASAQLAREAFRFGQEGRSAIIGMPLRVRSDLNLTLTGEALSLVPGSLIVDTDRESSILFMHVFPVRDRLDVERHRAGMYGVEARIIQAIGSADEIRRVSEPPPSTPSQTEG
ncbi:Na+/H+ antiporter subunit E [Pilimelia columellifera]|uniref:Na+/H+ antiporter subunit E n=1 Tax=Pilimelia columellifera subsp. columellifera TaxID=706583 RepID=A0ABN3NT69_9ACTN